ncbi:hypothetical protein ACFPGO_07655 [Arcanobacterium canis]|uniref:Uncharacterized protein n=1 Tax=Arcanobacterium canis TaxID=999183 RepID=A0ABY8FXY9_9ACTO|nr:hypothetical protein [Arcanobacterium canis]WFM83362.1 hypothetical protein P7079_08240 [Arcanobacterium canis]
MKRFLKLTLSLLIALAGVLVGLSSTLSFGDEYMRVIAGYPATNTVLNLSAISDDGLVGKAVRVAQGEVEKNGGVIVRRDPLVSRINGQTEGYRFGFGGKLSNAPAQAELEFGGVKIFSQENLAALSKSQQKSTLGLDQVQAEVIADIPSIDFSSRAVGMHLDELITRSGTARGAYYVIGLTPSRFDKISDKIAGIVATPKAQITAITSGESATEGVFLPIIRAFLAIDLIMISMMFLVGIYQSMKQMGIYLLLGLTKREFLTTMWRFSLIGAGIGVASIGVIEVWERWEFSINTQTVIDISANIGLYIVSLLIACVPTILAASAIHPVNAIRNRVSQRVIVGAIAVLFILTSGASITGLHFIDGPMIQIAKIQEIRSQWQPVEQTRILHEDRPGTNQLSSNGASEGKQREYFNWYASIEDKPGVQLINTFDFNAQTIKQWREDFSYENLPIEPFWYFAASPNYLRSTHFDVPKTDEELARSGVRVYYIPESYSREQQKAIRGWLTENDKDRLDSPIVTKFTKNPRFEFRTYIPREKFFTWNAQAPQNSTVSDPVIYLATTENMTYFENESLGATGLEDSYIKLDAQAAEKYANERYLSQYHLEDNAPQFIPVSDFLAGLHKSFVRLLQLFGTVIALGALIETILLVGLVQLYGKAHAQCVAVMRLLGYPLIRIFWAPFALVFATTVIGTLIGIPLKSDGILCITPILGAIQIVVLFAVARRTATTHISHILKAN